MGIVALDRESRMVYPAHLDSAARVLERILAEIHPEHHWVVTVREGDARDGASGPAAAVGRGEPRAVGQDPDSVGDRHPLSAPDGRDEDALDQAA
jgi:hypothetical protein